MKYLLIPAAVYFIVTGYFLFIESKIPYYPYQHLFEFFPNHAVHALGAFSLGLFILLDLNIPNTILLILGFADIAYIVYKASKLEMQELSEAMQHLGYKAIILGIMIEALRKNVIVEQPEKKKKKKKKVKKMVEVEVEEEVISEEDETTQQISENNVQEKQKQSTQEKKKDKSKSQKTGK